MIVGLEYIRALLLCNGAHAGRGVRELLSARGLSGGFIHGVVISLPGGAVVNTRVLDHTTTPGAPLLVVDDEQFYIHVDKARILVDILPAGPALVPFDSRLRGPLRSFSMHNRNTLFCSPVDYCAFGIIGKPCSFCTYQMTGPVRRLPRGSFETALAAVVEINSEVRTIAIGGGTPDLRDFGCRYYSDLASAAAQQGLACSVEIVPPPDTATLDLLLASGVSSLVMSLEIWDDDVRQRVCLGKGELSKSHYLRSWRRVIDVLGPGSIASVLLVGIETLDSTIVGAQRLIEEGVIPTLIPFRHYDHMAGSPSSSCDVSTYLQAVSEVRDALKSAGLDPLSRPGCTACGGCSMEIPAPRGEVDRAIAPC